MSISNDTASSGTPGSGRESTTILTQDPNVADGTIVPNDSPYEISSPGKVIIAGPLILPGLNFTIECRTLETANDSHQRPAAINVNGLPGAAPPPDPQQPASSGAKGSEGDSGLSGGTGGTGETGGNGSKGADGSAGGNAGNITISANKISAGTRLPLRAEGGVGGSGQRGQFGGSGGPGGEGGYGVPVGGGMRPRGLGGPGGKGGNGGNGGKGGPGGDGGTIEITCPASSTGSFAPTVKGGAGGSGGAAGGPGSGGPGGGGFSLSGSPGAAGQPGNSGTLGRDGQIKINE